MLTTRDEGFRLNHNETRSWTGTGLAFTVAGVSGAVTAAEVPEGFLLPLTPLTTMPATPLFITLSPQIFTIQSADPSLKTFTTSPATSSRSRTLPQPLATPSAMTPSEPSKTPISITPNSAPSSLPDPTGLAGVTPESRIPSEIKSTYSPLESNTSIIASTYSPLDSVTKTASPRSSYIIESSVAIFMIG